MRVKQALYFDHQASTPVAAVVLNAMMPYLGEDLANPHSMDHSLGWTAQAAVKSSQKQIGKLAVADDDEVILTSGATEANNLALLGLGRRHVGGPRKKVLLSAIEHKSVLAVGRVMRDQLGFNVLEIPVGPTGEIDMEWLQLNMDEDVLLVSVMAVNNEIGTIQDLEQISGLTKAVGALLHSDCAQAPFTGIQSGYLESVDLISFSAHKMYGPKGIGALVVRRAVQAQLEPMIYGGGQQGGLRSGTIPTFLAVGMGAAAQHITDGNTSELLAQVGKLRDKFVNALTANEDFIYLNGPSLEARHCGNANLRFEGFNAQDLLGALQPRLAASSGAACTSGIPESSHVLRAIGLSSEQAEASIRFSFGLDTTEADIDAGLLLMRESITRLAEI